MRVFCAFALILAGCTTQKATYLPDGRKGYTITCNGTARDWSSCYEKAGETCQARGYDILSKDESEAIGGGPYFVTGGTYGRTLVIACK